MKRKPKEALVLIHLSSLDSFTDMEREATGGDENAWDLGRRILSWIREHPGPIFIGDQKWLFVGRESRPRRWLMDEIKALDRKDITWVRFDEQDEGELGWEKFLKKLDRWLKKNKITQVLLGGLFLEGDPENPGAGCVSYTYYHLKDWIPTRIEVSAVGGICQIEEL